jgi:hypothetical protein
MNFVKKEEKKKEFRHPSLVQKIFVDSKDPEFESMFWRYEAGILSISNRN